MRAGGQWLVRTGVEWDSVGALTLARPDVALRWEARGAWLVSGALLSNAAAPKQPQPQPQPQQQHLTPSSTNTLKTNQQQ